MLAHPYGAGDTSWFVRERFGMFIHWGLYSLGARHEWLMAREKIPPAVYRQRYFPRFDPDLYDPNLWAAAAAGAGMKYMVVTAKHHEGFCLFDSAHTDYKATNSPAKRDLLRPMLDAFRSHGVRAGCYYSLLDWSHPDFIVDPHIGPYAHLSADERAKLNAGRDQRRYAAYMRNQVRELLTNYGDIDVLWFDFSYPKADGSGKGRADWESDQLIEMVRKLRPDIIVDDRLDIPGVGDIHTPEQFQPRQWYRHGGQKVVWEACQTLCWSWGYDRDDALLDRYRSSDELIRTLIDCVAKGGNLLLNIGPTGRGEIDARALSRLADIGTWMRRHGRSITGCTEAPADIPRPDGCALTWNPETRRLYVHVLSWPYRILHLPGLAGRVEYAQLLHDSSEVLMQGLEQWQERHNENAGIGRDVLSLKMPPNQPKDVIVPVIELFLKE
ncbi:alpha-L-fucosidase [Planctomycetota bacterium]|nr:alpha-L-fucosidase [Planctomycetota bacterium]